jgi:hypothetical protein
MRRAPRSALLLALALALAPAARAAGGHHAVDDATILDPGQCELEAWYVRSRAREDNLHVGPNCRVGPVEIGAALDRSRAGGAFETLAGAQVKWATALGASPWRAGLSLTPQWRHAGGTAHAGTTVLALATWNIDERWTAHANAGRDLLRGAPDEGRGGLALEWTPRDAWTLVAERYREQGTHFARVGARWNATQDWTMDLSRSQRLHGPLPSTWTFGLTRAFAAPF